MSITLPYVLYLVHLLAYKQVPFYYPRTKVGIFPDFRCLSGIDNKPKGAENFGKSQIRSSRS